MEIKNPFNGNVVFSNSELVCRDNDPKAGDGFICPQALEAMAFLRAFVRRSMVINSCCRSLEHNRNIGGKDGSFHLYEGDLHDKGCCAWDISTDGWTQEEKDNLIELAWQTSWSVGVANSFVHVDCRSLIYGRRQAFWYYGSYNGKHYDIFAKVDRIIP